MKDTDFEQISARAKLLTNEGYFARFRELAPEIGVTAAWQQVESELPFDLIRYSSFHAFEAAKKRYSQGTIGTTTYFRKIRS